MAIPDTPDWANTNITINQPVNAYKHTFTDTSLKVVSSGLVDVNAYSSLVVSVVGGSTFPFNIQASYFTSDGVMNVYSAAQGFVPSGATGEDTTISIPCSGGSIAVTMTADTPQDWDVELIVWGLFHEIPSLDILTVLNSDPNNADYGYTRIGDSASFKVLVDTANVTMSMYPMRFRPGTQQVTVFVPAGSTGTDFDLVVVDLYTTRVIYEYGFSGRTNLALLDWTFKAAAPYRIDIMPTTVAAPGINLDVFVNVPVVVSG